MPLKVLLPNRLHAVDCYCGRNLAAVERFDDETAPPFRTFFLEGVANHQSGSDPPVLRENREPARQSQNLGRMSLWFIGESVWNCGVPSLDVDYF